MILAPFCTRNRPPNKLLKNWYLLFPLIIFLRIWWRWRWPARPNESRRVFINAKHTTAAAAGATFLVCVPVHLKRREWHSLLSLLLLLPRDAFHVIHSSSQWQSGRPVADSIPTRIFFFFSFRISRRRRKRRRGRRAYTLSLGSRFAFHRLSLSARPLVSLSIPFIFVSRGHYTHTKIKLVFLLLLLLLHEAKKLNPKRKKTLNTSNLE